MDLSNSEKKLMRHAAVNKATAGSFKTNKFIQNAMDEEILDSTSILKSARDPARASALK